MGGVKLKDLKTHTNAVGGAWGDDTWAALVKDNYETVLESSSGQAEERQEETRPKRALLIPLSTFTSAQIIKIATMTGQTDHYKKFGADEETPSGVEDDVRNSTQRSETESYNLVLSDVSRIPNREEESIEFEELGMPGSTDFLKDDNEHQEMELTDIIRRTMVEPEPEKNSTEVNAIEAEPQDEQQEESEEVIEFSELQRENSKLGSTFKAKKPNRNISVVENHNKSVL